MTKQYLHLSAIFLCLCLALAAQTVQASSIIPAHAEKDKSHHFTSDDNNAVGITSPVTWNFHALTGDITADADSGGPGASQDAEHHIAHGRADGVYPKPFLEHPEIIPDAADQCRPGHDLGCRNENRRFFGAASPAAVPVPGSLLLIGSGLAGLLGLRKRRQ